VAHLKANPEGALHDLANALVGQEKTDLKIEGKNSSSDLIIDVY
jgi:hypothetical protein